MKQLIVATVLVGISNLAIAADAPQLKHRFTEYANVINVEPVFRQVRYEKPQKECWIEQEEYVVSQEGYRQNSRQSNRQLNRRSNSSQSYSGADAIIGGLIGGVIGNQLGKNGNRGARNGATVAGAIVGSVIANETRGSDVSRHRNNQRTQTRQPQRVTRTRPVEKCRETTNTLYFTVLVGVFLFYVQYKSNEVHVVPVILMSVLVGTLFGGVMMLVTTYNQKKHDLTLWENL